LRSVMSQPEAALYIQLPILETTVAIHSIGVPEQLQTRRNRCCGAPWRMGLACGWPGPRGLGRDLWHKPHTRALRQTII
jgi:hypothetical protein